MTDKPPSLAELRAEIDRIDEAMHRLLMARGEIIDRLIAVKKTSESGSAFRPGREAAMMRALAERHEGLLPLDTAEGIWRVVIATFTHVQAPFAVHADVSGGDAPMRDTARFHFGFSVPYKPHESAAAVIAAVARARGDLGIFRLDQGVSSGAWWRDLVGEKRPKVIARLPFIERPNHPAGTPVFVISKPLADAAVRDVVLYSASFDRWREGAGRVIAAFGGEVIANAGGGHGLSALIALPGSLEPAALRNAAAAEGAHLSDLDEIGSHAARFAVGGAR
jgi:chorismate mutase